MQEGKRQKQVGGLIQEEINAVFQRMGLSFIHGTMVSVSSVKVTPDLLEARIYLSIFKTGNPEEQNSKAVIEKIEDRHWEIKKELASRIKNQLRRIPELKFFLDDTLDHVFKMEELFKKIKEEDNKGEETGETDNNK
ncbi:MAG: 30S ribosome-binding factor RbfA [Candidatus Dadabacteria bacterium]